MNSITKPIILPIKCIHCIILIACDDKDIKTEYGCDWGCDEMARAGYCETGYSGIAPKCVLKSPIKNLCKKSCKVCGTNFSFLQVLGQDAGEIWFQFSQ